MEIIAALIGAGIVAVSPLVPALRPVAKTVVKGGLALADAAKGAAVVAGQQWSEVVAQAEADRQAGHEADVVEETEVVETAETAAEPAMAGQGQTTESSPVTIGADPAKTAAKTMDAASLSTILRPAAQAAVKGGLALAEAAKGAAAAASQQWSEVVAEAEADLKTGNDASMVESIAVVKTAAAQTGVAPDLADTAAELAEMPSVEISGHIPTTRAWSERAAGTAGDDLKKIKGVGPKVAELLQAAGITTFAQLEATDVDQLHQILDRAGTRFRLIDPTPWPAQARQLMGLDEQT